MDQLKHQSKTDANNKNDIPNKLIIVKKFEKG